MTAERQPPSGRKREQRMKPVREDSYRDTAKLPDPAKCPRCRATYLKGHWTWQPAPPGAKRHTCPACSRIEDDFPAGYLTLKGDFLAQHREEILNLVTTRAARLNEEHPLQRLIGVMDVDGGVVVTTTDAHLASSIATAVHKAFKGELDLQFSRGENLVRATWSR